MYPSGSGVQLTPAPGRGAWGVSVSRGFTHREGLSPILPDSCSGTEILAAPSDKPVVLGPQVGLNGQSLFKLLENRDLERF
jgi:hypothetical protein